MEPVLRVFSPECRSVWFNKLHPATYYVLSPPAGFDDFECLPPMTFIVENDGMTHYNRRPTWEDSFIDEFGYVHLISHVAEKCVHTIGGPSINLRWCTDYYFV